jgi:hypothetical protein
MLFMGHLLLVPGDTCREQHGTTKAGDACFEFLNRSA